MPGPLHGVDVIEFAAIGPVPFCGMLLADLGATVTVIDRPGGDPAIGPAANVCRRGKHRIGIDLKDEAGTRLVADLSATADIVIEGFRPGVMERLGLGPDQLIQANPRLIYGRMTGWGREGPRSGEAGHDINYLSTVGALNAIGPAAEPTVPLNLIADYGGGAMYLVLGITAALFERATSGRGQVVDAAMIDGVASLLTPTFEMRAAGLWNDSRASNLLDGGAPFYTVYATADGGHVAVGALEPQFYDRMIRLLGLEPSDLPHQYDEERWPELRSVLAAKFREKPRKHWHDWFAGEDACVTPVLSFEEAVADAHNQARKVFMTSNESHPQPSAAPRLSRTPTRAEGRVAATLTPAQIRQRAGRAADDVADLVQRGVIEVAS